MKKTVLILIGILLISVAAILTIPALRDKITWNWLSKRNTVQDFNRYLQLNQNGKHVAQARENIRNLLVDTVQYNHAMQKGTETAIRGFIRNYPGNIKEQEARYALFDVVRKTAFKKAIGSASISKLSLFVKFYPGTPDSEKAIDEIWKTLMSKYPGSLYTCNTSSESLKSALPGALSSNQPFIVAFAPRNVKGNGRWEWDTNFEELAGQSVTFTHMSPSIRKPNGEVYGFGYGTGEMTYTVDVQSFGSGTYSWWCQGDFGGSTVTLDYGMVSSYTTLSSN